MDRWNGKVGLMERMGFLLNKPDGKLVDVCAKGSKNESEQNSNG